VAEKLVNGCPPATQDITINLKNRKIAVDKANYGPLDPAFSNTDFWRKKASLFNTTVEIDKEERCKNCAAFIQT
jgi:hypothetical protein